MPSTYDIKTNVGKVRLLISDVGGKDGSSFIFNDEEVETFLLLSEENLRYAAAEALRTIAANETMVMKAITFLDLKTEGPKVTEALIKAAEKLEEREDSEATLDFATMDVDIFSHRQLREEWFLLNAGTTGWIEDA